MNFQQNTQLTVHSNLENFPICIPSVLPARNTRSLRRRCPQLDRSSAAEARIRRAQGPRPKTSPGSENLSTAHKQRLILKPLPSNNRFPPLRRTLAAGLCSPLPAPASHKSALRPWLWRRSRASVRSTRRPWSPTSRPRWPSPRASAAPAPASTPSPSGRSATATSTSSTS
jgi:hypothetical protein